MLKLVDWLEFMACADRFGNFRQKDSGALIFSSAGTLNRWTRIQMACSPVRVINVKVDSLRLVYLDRLKNYRQRREIDPKATVSGFKQHLCPSLRQKKPS